MEEQKEQHPTGNKEQATYLQRQVCVAPPKFMD